MERLNCPHCKHRARIRSSKRPSPAFYEMYIQCRNDYCGWEGKAHLEFAATTTPSHCPDPDVRIPLDPQSRRWLIQQLAESA